MNKQEAKQHRADVKEEARQHRADVKQEAADRKAAAEMPQHPKPDTPEQRKAKVEAYLRLVKLDAAPSISFNPHDDPQVYAQAEATVAAEKYAEIIRNRKILGIGVAHDQMNVNEPPEWRKGREKNEKAAAAKPAGGVLTTKSFGS